jgi:hypothetical protein
MQGLQLGLASEIGHRGRVPRKGIDELFDSSGLPALGLVRRDEISWLDDLRPLCLTLTLTGQASVGLSLPLLVGVVWPDPAVEVKESLSPDNAVGVLNMQSGGGGVLRGVP